MTDIISRLLDEAEKAQRKGHLVLAEVCRDASDKIGLLEHEANLMRERLHSPSSDSGPDRTLSSVVSVLSEASDEIERLRAALRTIISIPMSMCLNASDLAQRQKDIAFEALGARHD